MDVKAPKIQLSEPDINKNIIDLIDSNGNLTFKGTVSDDGKIKSLKFIHLNPANSSVESAVDFINGNNPKWDSIGEDSNKNIILIYSYFIRTCFISFFLKTCEELRIFFIIMNMFAGCPSLLFQSFGFFCIIISYSFKYSFFAMFRNHDINSLSFLYTFYFIYKYYIIFFIKNQ